MNTHPESDNYLTSGVRENIGTIETIGTIDVFKGVRAFKETLLHTNYLNYLNYLTLTLGLICEIIDDFKRNSMIDENRFSSVMLQTRIGKQLFSINK